MSQNETDLRMSMRFTEEKTQIILTFIIGFILLFWTSLSPAAVHNPFAIYEKQTVREIDLNQYAVAHNDFQKHSAINTAKFIPTDMQSTTDQRYVMNRIVRYSMQGLIQDSHFRETSVGAAASNIQEKMRTRISLAKGKYDHTLGISVKPIESAAMVSYKGYVNADLKYQGLQNAVNFNVKWTW